MICPYFTPPLYFLFSPELPELLYYAHIPSAFVGLLVGLFLFVNGRHLLLNRLLFAIALFFSLWTLANLILWTSVESEFLLFVWTFDVILTSLIAVFSVYFVYVFLDEERRDVSPRQKVLFLFLLSPALILAPTYLNLSGFDIANCDAFGFEGAAYKLYYIALNVLAMVWILVLMVRKYRTAAPDFRKQISLMGVGIELFLFSFFTIVFLADYLTEHGFFADSRLEFYGLFGMAVFMAFVGYLIVQYRTFNVGLLAAQALVVAQALLIASEFTFAQNNLNRLLIAITLVLTGTMGVFLVRSVKREIKARTQVELLAKDLSEANRRQEGLINFLSHEVKGFLTRYQGFFAGLVDGDYGSLPDEARKMAERALPQSREDVHMVMDILQASSIKKGVMTFKSEPFDLAAVARDIVSSLEPAARAKGLVLALEGDGSVMVTGDKTQIADHVVRNLVQNAVTYTKEGSVVVGVRAESDSAILSVKDTGVGLSDADKARLFTEGGRGEKSQEINVHSTGYGLFIAKSIVEAHGGVIRADSAGPGTGSTFTVTLPLRNEAYERAKASAANETASIQSA